MATAPAADLAAAPDIHPDRDYQQFLDAGRFMLLRDRQSGEAFFYPRVAAPRTGSRDLEWFEASGLGTVHAATVVSQKPPTPNYNVVLVDLEEGPRVMSRVEGIPSEAVAIGMAVVARIDQINGKGVLVFDPVHPRGGAA